MAASPASDGSSDGATASRGGECADAIAGGGARVISLSASRSVSDASTDTLNSVADRFTALLQHADLAVERLECAIVDSQEIRRAAVEASAQLQERLTLGAQMLAAFQTQIAHVEASIGALTALEQQSKRTPAIDSKSPLRLTTWASGG